MKKLVYSSYFPAIISIIAVIIFFAWGYIEGTYQHSWMIFMVAGLAQVIVAAIKKSNKENEETQKESK